MELVSILIIITIITIIIGSMVVRWAPKWSLSFTFPDQNSEYSYLISTRTT